MGAEAACGDATEDLSTLHVIGIAPAGNLAAVAQTSTTPAGNLIKLAYVDAR